MTTNETKPNVDSDSSKQADPVRAGGPDQSRSGQAVETTDKVEDGLRAGGPDQSRSIPTSGDQ